MCIGGRTRVSSMVVAERRKDRSKRKVLGFFSRILGNLNFSACAKILRYFTITEEWSRILNKFQGHRWAQTSKELEAVHLHEAS